MQDSLVLIHLSDIHFNLAWVGDSYDLDHDLRNELELDAVTMCDKLGAVSGILVSGDIAFSGKRDEYQVSIDWLGRLCGKLGIEKEDVWTSPGNHDIDRSVIRSSHVLQAIHQNLRPQDPAKVDERIRQYCKEDELAKHLIYEPLRNYNEFAALFGCEIGPDTPLWKHDFALSDGSRLRVCGLNSTLVSNDLDNNGANRLILGSHQCTLPREGGVEYLTLCHHPPQWLLDGDEVEYALNARARIQLFGHKHIQTAVRINHTIRLIAGSVHPDRTEANWRPRYNYIVVVVNGAGAGRTLEVRLCPRVWSDSHKQFCADYGLDGSPFRHYSLPIQTWSPIDTNPALPMDATFGQEIGHRESEEPPMVCSDGNGDSTVISGRKLTYRFLSLPYHKRIAIAQELDLLQDEDSGLQDAELFKRVFQRAKERSIVDSLWNAVEKRYR